MVLEQQENWDGHYRWILFCKASGGHCFFGHVRSGFFLLNNEFMGWLTRSKVDERKTTTETTWIPTSPLKNFPKPHVATLNTSPKSPHQAQHVILRHTNFLVFSVLSPFFSLPIPSKNTFFCPSICFFVFPFLITHFVHFFVPFLPAFTPEPSSTALGINLNSELVVYVRCEPRPVMLLPRSQQQRTTSSKNDEEERWEMTAKPEN
ncbi:hypothetical protein VTJ04DRAFT_1077 [Mycothermus thermophilus]|uniref:uncharacterized protein n=1 Tax=Humicola insolens TaxID=85995 RepID=UPI00374344B3